MSPSVRTHFLTLSWDLSDAIFTRTLFERRGGLSVQVSWALQRDLASLIRFQKCPIFKNSGSAHDSIRFQFDWCIWPPSQYINFRWVPQAYRVLYVNVVTVIWDIFLSYIKHYVNTF